MRKMILIVLTIFSLLILTACDASKWMESVKEDFSNRLASVSIPFEWFYDESLIAKEEVDVQPVEGIDLITKEIPYTAWENLKSNLIHLGDAIQGEDSLEALTSVDTNIKNMLSEVNYDKRMNWRRFESILLYISEVDHQYFQSFTIKAIGERKSEEEHYVAWVDMNVVNDTEEFLIIPIQMHFDTDGRLYSIQANGEAHHSKHTATPLSEDAFLYETTHLSFIDEWEKFLKKLDSLQEEEYESLQDLLNEYDLDNDVKILNELKNQRSNNHEVGFVEYMLDDQSLAAKTWYEWIVVNENGTHHYHILFDRGKKSITEIRTLKSGGDKDDKNREKEEE